MTTDPGSGREPRSQLLREAAMIVATGLALGVAFNALALSARSPRALPWIARPAPLADVGALVAPDPPPDAPAVVAGEAPPSGGPGVKPETPPPQHAAPPAEPASRGPRQVTGAHDGTEAPPVSVAGPPPVAGIPVIPDVEGPLRVPRDLVSKLVAARAALVVDAREAVEFAAGHIPGAINVPYDEAVRDPSRVEHLDAGGRPTIVYCSGGDCEASRMLAEMMVRDFGRRRVLVFEGGYPEWAAAGEPVSRETP